MTPAMKRFEQLRKHYTAAIPTRRKISRERRREVSWAAALSLLIENLKIEVELGLRPEMPPEIAQMRDAINGHLRAAHSTSTFETRGPRC